MWDEETLLEMDEVVESVDQQNRQRAICASYDEDECMAAEQGLKAALCIWTVTRHAEVEWIECNESDYNMFSHFLSREGVCRSLNDIESKSHSD